MNFSEMPAAEVEIDEKLVAGLLAEQWREWSGQDVSLLANGWDNVLFRVGPDLVGRFPRRELAAELVENEARWLPSLAPHLPIRVPVPVLSGRPGLGYPWSWNLVPWLEGRSAATASQVDTRRAAQDLGRFLRVLHRPAPKNAPLNKFRGGPLSEKGEMVRTRASEVAGLQSPDRIMELWEELSSVAAHDRAGTWLHGDLHPHNILVVDGVVSAVIDFGDITRGDPATDLAVAWMLSPDHVAVFRSEYLLPDKALWARARGWALHLSLACIVNSADNPTMSAIGKSTLEAVLSDRPS